MGSGRPLRKVEWNEKEDIQVRIVVIPLEEIGRRKIEKQITEFEWVMQAVLLHQWFIETKYFLFMFLYP